jgi:hypothetical protein
VKLRFFLTVFVVLLIGPGDSMSQHQEIGHFSMEADVNYYYYFISQKRKSDCNTGYSLLLSYTEGNFKYSSGINYSTKNSYYHADPSSSTSQLTKREYKLQYVNIPFIVSYGKKSLKKFSTQLVCGIIFNKIISYDITSYYLNDPSITEKSIDANKKTGISLRIGMNLRQSLNHKLYINYSPFIDYKATLDHQGDSSPDFRNLTDDRLSVGVKVGIEFVIN